jgi:V/A-type H+-transporting ATPase subunit F
MRYTYYVIADEDVVLGFRTAGIMGRAVANREEALEALRLAQEKHVGVVILTEEVCDMVSAEVEEIRFGEALPLIVEIPGPRGALPGRKSLPDMIREALGIRV